MNLTGTGFAWEVKDWAAEMSLNNITFSTTVTISPIPPWFFSQPEVDLQIHECIQKGQIDINIKSYSTEYIRTVYYAFLSIYTDGSRNPEIGQIKSNQITFIVTSPQHKCLGE